ncbi:bifunctional nuclease family protein [Georgenia halophila]|uniref:Bifunctional nuclease family protein n=1 Tax=Georgenia halophila TaxID=620889 RepID=A0ABP8L9Q7_9MICO
MREMVVLGVRVSVPGNEVVVVLGEPGGSRVLPIVIGPREGAAIASAQAGLVPPRPLTHDLLVSVLEHLGAAVTEVRVTQVIDGIFHAELVLSGGQVVDARPSDAIAVALRSKCAVLCDEDLLSVAGVPVEEAGLEQEEAQALPAGETGAAVMEEFRAFLEGVEPEDFATDEPPAEDGPGGPTDDEPGLGTPEEGPDDQR